MPRDTQEHAETMEYRDKTVDKRLTLVQIKRLWRWPAYNSYIDQAKSPKTRSKIRAQLVEQRYHKGIVLSPISRVTGRAQMITVNELV